MTVPEDVLADPSLLAGRAPDNIEPLIADAEGWAVETLRRGSQRSRGWLLRQYDHRGNPTGCVIRWHPGGGHHGPQPYWRVSSPRYGRSGEIR